MISVPLVNRLYDLVTRKDEDNPENHHMTETGMGGVLLLWIFYVSHIINLSKDVIFNFLPLYAFFGIFVPCLGILAARTEIVEKYKKKDASLFAETMVAIVLVVFGYFGWHYLGGRTKWLTIFLLLGYVFLSVATARIPILRDIFIIMGKNSKYMYLCHSFFFAYFFQEQIYGFKWAGIILLILIACTLPLSVMLVWMERQAIKVISFAWECAKLKLK